MCRTLLQVTTVAANATRIRNQGAMRETPQQQQQQQHAEITQKSKREHATLNLLNALPIAIATKHAKNKLSTIPSARVWLFSGAIHQYWAGHGKTPSLPPFQQSQKKEKGWPLARPTQISPPCEGGPSASRSKSIPPGGLAVLGDHPSIFASTGVGLLVAVIGSHPSTPPCAQKSSFQESHRTLLAAVDELPGVHALHRDDELVVALELVRVLELDLGERRAPSRLVDDVLDHTLDVPVALRVVQLAELHGPLAEARVGGKYTSLTLPLPADNLTHGFSLVGGISDASREALSTDGAREAYNAGGDIYDFPGLHAMEALRILFWIRASCGRCPDLQVLLFQGFLAQRYT